MSVNGNVILTRSMTCACRGHDPKQEYGSSGVHRTVNGGSGISGVCVKRAVMYYV